jgi:hypothetical protein
MLRLLMFVALAAAVMTGWDNLGAPDAQAGAAFARAAAGSLTIDVRSFGMGFAVALMLATFQRIPWHNMSVVLREWLRGGRRMLQFMMLAALLVAVLMYY